MIALIWQTALLLLGAYFFGAFLACLVRRTFFALRPKPEPAAAVPTSTSEATVRFERALSGQGSAPIAAQPAAAAAAPRAQPSVAAAPAARAPAPPKPQPTVAAAPAPRVAPPPPAAQEPDRSAALLAAARSVGTVARRSPPPPIAATNADTAAALSAAAATAARREPGPAELGLAVAAPAAPAPEVSPRAQVPQVAASADHLTRIRGIDQALQARLNALGVRTYAQIAAWRAEDVERIGTELNLGVRIARENWIEQAQILAGGGETVYTRAKQEPAPFAAEPAPSTVEERAATPLAAATAAAAAAAAVQTPAVSPAPVSAPRPPEPVPAASAGDDLQRIANIDADLAQRLSAEGVTTYAEIAAWGPGDVVRLDHLLGLEGSIMREYWVEQAAVLARGEATAFSRALDRRRGTPLQSVPPAAAIAQPVEPPADAAPVEPSAADRAQRNDISALRSVKSEAYRPDGTHAGAPAAPDDLKRIRGIGLLIEKRLNAMGITRYEHVANWTSDDIERVSSKLEFKGRIERENWIEQARILASGGQTEFSRRIDREVEKRR